MRTSSFLPKLSAIAGLTLVSAASADPNEGLALNRFDPSFAGDDMFGVPSAAIAGDRTVHAGLLMDYAHNPLVLRRESDDQNLGPVVSDQAFVHVNATLALFQRVALNVDVPLAAYQAGSAPSGGGQSFAAPEPTQFGDLRLAGRLRILGQRQDLIQLSIAGNVWLPTGAKNSFVSDEQVRGLPQLLLSGERGAFLWSSSLGFEFRPQRMYKGVEQGRTFRWGAAIGYRAGASRALQLGLEGYGGVVVEDVNRLNTTSEVLASVRYRFATSFQAGIAAGPGLTSGLGTPDFRGIFTFAYSPASGRDSGKADPPRDRDKDRIVDSNDACPDEYGQANADPARHGCPAPQLDGDHDGIYDEQDACPTVIGTASDDPLFNGCPPDADGDGIVDAVDACVKEPGLRSNDPKAHGCPSDKDGDGIGDAKDACIDVAGIATNDPASNGCPGDQDRDSILDTDDACPAEKGAPDKDPKQHGCPKSVRVTNGEIIILQQVQFDLSKSTIRPVSDSLLDEVSGVLGEHREMLKIEVQGHTDDRGFPDENDQLSQDRAQAVVDALVQRGIDRGRLMAKGYGQRKPVATNKNPEGRQKNRRVQFVIIEKQNK